MSYRIKYDLLVIYENKIIIIILKNFKSLTSVYSIVFIADKRRFVTLCTVAYYLKCVIMHNVSNLRRLYFRMGLNKEAVKLVSPMSAL